MNSKTKHEENTESSNGYGLPNQTNNKDCSKTDLLEEIKDTIESIDVKDAKIQAKKTMGELVTTVEDTPFNIIETERGFHVVMGKHAMGEPHEKKKDAIIDARTITWKRVMQVVGVFMENYNKE